MPGRGALGALPGATARSASPTVRLREPSGAERDIVVKGSLDVGRNVNGLKIDDPAASARHAMFMAAAEGLVIIDLGSRNGTSVNGRRIMRPMVITEGDTVQIGTSVLTVLSTGHTLTGRRSVAPAAALEMFDADPSMIEVRARVPLVVMEPPALPGADDGRTAAVPLATIAAAVAPEPLGPVFPNYTERRRIVPIWAWFPVRIVLFVVYMGLCVALFVRPDGGLFFFWRLVVPIMPMILLVAPGLWRNSCPIAATNQFPRLAGFTRGNTLPTWLKNSAFLIPVTLFLLIVPTRKVWFNTNGPSTALLLLGIISAAFVGGVVFKGKSGWCSQFCPMLPLERLYGQTPYVTLPNSHCQPCVGCTKNCYDFNPDIAYQADMVDPEPGWSGPRKLFAAAFPGIIVGFAAFGSVPEVSAPEVYLHFAAAVVVSIGIFFILDSYLRLPSALIAALGGGTAITLFYWYQAPAMADAWSQVTTIDLGPVLWPIRILAVVLAVIWFVRTTRVRATFLDQVSGTSSVRVELSTAKRLKDKAVEEGDEVRFLPDDIGVAATTGQSLLDAAEAAGVTLEAGCRMGVCGADPIAVIEGADCLSGVTDDEAKTLRRLGLADNARMACCARLQGGAVQVSLEVEKGGTTSEPTMPVDPSIRRVVIIGNGIAGVTTADFVRRNHPDCEIHVIAREPHALYNRMGISRVVYGRSAMQGLYLLDDDWYDEHRVTTWLNTHVTAIVPAQRSVALGTGETLTYDRLVLATGASGNVPPLPGWGLPGTFILREVQDAMAIRAYVQTHGVRNAVVAGAGLLGLEAAHALRELGLGVVVLDRGSRLLGKQCDERSSALLASYFDRLGIRVLPMSEAREVAGGIDVEGVTLKSDVTIECGLFLLAAGNQANVGLARDAGIAVNRGIVVNERMETSIPGIFAVGDVAEHEGQMLGLWPIATEQAEVAAVNVLGGDDRYEHPMPAAILKGVGIDMTSVGRYEEVAGDEVIVLEGPGTRYRKLVLRDGVAVGGIVLGFDNLSPHLIKVVKTHAVLAGLRDALWAGDWDVLAKL